MLFSFQVDLESLFIWISDVFVVWHILNGWMPIINTAKYVCFVLFFGFDNHDNFEKVFKKILCQIWFFLFFVFLVSNQPSNVLGWLKEIIIYLLVIITTTPTTTTIIITGSKWLQKHPYYTWWWLITSFLVSFFLLLKFQFIPESMLFSKNITHEFVDHYVESNNQSIDWISFFIFSFSFSLRYLFCPEKENV